MGDAPLLRDFRPSRQRSRDRSVTRMPQSRAVDRDRLLFRVSLLVAIAAASSSLAGLMTGVYRDNIRTRAGFQGNDLVTLIVVVPLILIGLRYTVRGSLAGRLLWLGTMAYSLYNYSFYLFGAAFNELFIAYAGLVAASGAVLIIGLSHTNEEAVAAQIGDQPWLHRVAAYLIGLPALLGTLWLSQIVVSLATGTIPRAVTDSGIHTAVIFALDLAMLVPVSLLAGIWLIRRRAWGYVLAAVLLVKDGAYALALIGMSFFAARAGVADAWLLAPLWAVLGGLAMWAGLAIYRPLSGPIPGSAGQPPQPVDPQADRIS